MSKNNKSNDDFNPLLSLIVLIICGLIITIPAIVGFIKYNNDLSVKIVTIPFIILGTIITLSFIYCAFIELKHRKLSNNGQKEINEMVMEEDTIKFELFIKNAEKFIKLIFIIVWFCGVGAFTYTGIKREEILFVVFSIPFWIIGICIVRKIYIKSKEK